MPNPKLLHNLTFIPPLLIGVCAIALGLAWLLTDEPWLLDREANEALLNTTFAELFSADMNQNLPDYLRLVYRFFGLWVLSIGLLICAYVLVPFMGAARARKALHGVMGVILAALLYLELTFFPVSPFIYLTIGLAILYLISLWASVRLNQVEKN